MSKREKILVPIALLLAVSTFCVGLFLGGLQADQSLEEAQDRMADMVASHIESFYWTDYEEFCRLTTLHADRMESFNSAAGMISMELQTFCQSAGLDPSCGQKVLGLYESLVGVLERAGSSEELREMFMDCREYFELLFTWDRGMDEIARSVTAKELTQRLRDIEELYAKSGASLEARADALLQDAKENAVIPWEGPATGSDLYVMPTPGVYPSSDADLQLR